LQITEVGKKFYPHCKSILASIALAENELLAKGENITGTISITLSKALARSKIFDALSSFADKHPHVQFDIRFSDNFEDLHDENIDFAFRLGTLEDSSHMIAIPLVETQLVACATSNYLKRYGTPKCFSELGRSKLILMSPLNSSDALKKFFNKEKIHPDSIATHRCNDIEGIHQSVRANLGIGLLLDISIEQEIKDGTFTAILAERNLPRKRLYLLYKKSQWQTQKQVAFKEHVKSLLS